MKRLSLYLFLIFFTLQTPSQADDIRDFQIEGISVGDSLLDYYSENVINKNKTEGPRGKGKFYKTTIIDSKFNEYESMEFYLKTNDKKYKIYAIDALIVYNNQINKCKIKKSEIVKSLEKSLNEKFKSFEGSHSLDKSGKTKVYQSYFMHASSDHVRVECTDWTNKMKKKHKVTDNLGVSLVSKQVLKWIRDGYN